jgi:ribosomal protein L22
VTDEADRKPDGKEGGGRGRRRARGKDPEAAEQPKRRLRRRTADKAEAEASKPARESGKKAEAPEKPTEPRPARQRAAAQTSGKPPIVRAEARYVRSSSRKARLVCDHIRGKSVEEARAILAFTPRAVARDWSKVLESAVANAEHNHELVGDDLRVREAYADEGPTLKRYRPRAMGRATRIRKRTTHLTITLTPDLAAPEAAGRQQNAGRKGPRRSA